MTEYEELTLYLSKLFVFGLPLVAFIIFFKPRIAEIEEHYVMRNETTLQLEYDEVDNDPAVDWHFKVGDRVQRLGPIDVISAGRIKKGTIVQRYSRDARYFGSDSVVLGPYPELYKIVFDNYPNTICGSFLPHGLKLISDEDESHEN